MSKRSIVALSLCLLASALAFSASGQSGVAVSIRSGTSNPGTCQPSSRNVFINRASTPVLRICTSANTWTSLASLAGGTFTGPVLLADGTAAAPSLGFSSDSDGTGTGLFRSAANSIGFTTNGVERWVINASGALNCATDGGCDIGNGAADPRDLSLRRNLILRGLTSGTSTLHAPAIAGTADITLPSATSVLPIFTQQITFAGPTTARTITVPDADFTAARTDAANTFVGTHIFDSVTLDAGAGTETYTPSGVVEVNTTPASTTAVVTEETLWTYDLPANTLNVNGRGVRITTFGSMAANANTKNVRVYFGATLCVTSGNVGGNNAAWRAVCEIVRTGAATQVGGGLTTMGNSASGTSVHRTTSAAPTETLSGSVTLRMSCQNGVASAGDCSFAGVIVEVF